MSREISNLSAANVAADGLLGNGALGKNSNANAAQLMPKAKEFESILLGQWLQGAETSFGSIPGDDDDQDQGGEQMKGFAVQQLAKAFSDAGGIGIAGMVSKALAKANATESIKKK